MGLAVGGIGMSLTDFCRCTPQEFHCIYRSWEQMHQHQPWEQARFLACCVLQPYSKKALKATDVCRFGWEEPQNNPPPEQSTRQRFEELKKRAEAKRPPRFPEKTPE